MKIKEEEKILIDIYKVLNMSTLVRRKLIRSNLYTSFNQSPQEVKIIKQKTFLLPQKVDDKLTIVFDLDETLIHTHVTSQNLSDDLITIEFQGKQYFVSVRPGARELLKSLAGKYELILFTASTEGYATQIINNLERDGQIFDYKLYCHNCKEKFGQLFKDVHKLGRDLDRVLIFDDSTIVWTTSENLFVCKRYEGGNEDNEIETIKKVIEEFKRTRSSQSVVRFIL
ncbi:nuclear LIM interactor-interacting factor 3, putative [Entamoeba histolytica HM-3:IMSS]|uniref:Mitochondrial import inner membrane translocase subunit TIM50 n=6 Tax=Entamoeba histolytica TaxID=5759 RepID=C4LWZ2_ENTH1|nr:nuclear LIM interactor-interacting factor 3 [Entamoeba histolytica HM-1:IMSS]EMD45405.1 nuclear LIM interactorinteracting factor 3, putative [Entamoeba histolytica KU27]EMS11595.1 nuclear LIM interactor-interacting factor 3, putative [Entamoeba histolytica HM-3:IMSS]ENY64743.1 nuclear LIM interactor-interacting factor 3, putative [Entamoeba histolytica HM-1:IMSS-A]GAT93241.1 nli interacting factor-like phosphatase domain-containing protein [Entamoeba histolytica]EAL46789.1 nuclear LIM inter|eukprot:XP_652175.1 nuclear LIM interactor-interacting factor 3 [Entamoeba histolytica HM-1:IMSS]